MNLVQSARYRLDEMRPMGIDFSLHQGVYGHGYNSEIPSQLEKLKEMGIKTLKIFTTYRETGYLLDDPAKLSDLFRHCARLGIMVTAHCEYNPLIEQISANWKGTFNPKDHADLRPAEAEAKAIEFYGTCAMNEGCPLYIVHVSSEAGLNAIRKLREKGATIYAETTPTYLFLDRSKLEGPDGPLYVMTPPLRTKRDNQALQEGIMNGEFQVVATDHCTFTRDQKLANPDVRSTYPGVPGTEEMFLLLNTLREKNPGRLSMSDLVKLMSYNPAKLFGLYPEKGSLKVGTDADITLFDPRKGRVLQDFNVHTKANYTPYRGFEVNGEVVMTIMRGNVIMENGRALTEEGGGRFIRQC
jgi:dihydropyrimidinase